MTSPTSGDRRRAGRAAARADGELDDAPAATWPRSIAARARRPRRRGGAAQATPQAARAAVDRRAAGPGAHPDDRDPQTLDSTRRATRRRAGLGASTCGCTGSSAAGRASSAPRWPQHCTARALRRRPARGPHRLDRLGDPDEAAGPDRRTPAQRGARRRHRARDRRRGPHLPTWKHGPRSVRDGRGPRDTYG